MRWRGPGYSALIPGGRLAYRVWCGCGRATTDQRHPEGFEPECYYCKRDREMGEVLGTPEPESAR